MSTPTIDHIETTVYRLPLHAPLRWGKHGRMDEVRHVLVRVTLSSGAVGTAEAPPRPTIYGETAVTIPHIIAEQLLPRLRGRPADDYYDHLVPIRGNNTAKAAVDTAVQHALAQHNDVSLSVHLGATAEKLRVSYILGIGELDDVLADARRVYDWGVRVLKVKVGRDWRVDLERLRALQNAFPATDLYVDANECFTPNNAPGRLQQLAEMGVLYCEEPLPVEDIRARSAVCAAGHLPLIGDDSAFTERDLRRELPFRTFDILNIKVARTGYTQSRRMYQLARHAGLGMMVGSQAMSILGMSRTGLFGALPGIDHPSELSFFLKMKADIVAEPPPIVDGYMRTADLDAVTVDDALLREATVFTA